MKKERQLGRPSLYGTRLRHLTIRLTKEQMEKAELVGGGSASKGIRLTIDAYKAD